VTPAFLRDGDNRELHLFPVYIKGVGDPTVFVAFREVKP
jgi:hypothetical protein